MTDKMEQALQSAAEAFTVMAEEVRKIRTDIEGIQAMVHKHESLNNELSDLFRKYT